VLEQRGIPTVVMGTYEFEQLARLERIIATGRAS